MKRETSIANAKRLADRVKKVNGILATPCCRHSYVKIKRMYLFGSTVKGKENPDDTDILVEYIFCGERNEKGNLRLSNIKELNRKWPMKSSEYLGRWMRKGFKKMHFTLIEELKPNDIDVCFEIYPRWKVIPMEKENA